MVGKPVIVGLEDAIINRKHGPEARILVSPTNVGSTELVLGVVHLDLDEVVSEHFHDYGEEALFVVDGEGIVKLDGEEHTLCKGQSVLIRRGMKHELSNRNTDQFVVLFASAPLAPALRKEIG